MCPGPLATGSYYGSWHHLWGQMENQTNEQSQVKNNSNKKVMIWRHLRHHKQLCSHHGKGGWGRSEQAVCWMGKSEAMAAWENGVGNHLQGYFLCLLSTASPCQLEKLPMGMERSSGHRQEAIQTHLLCWERSARDSLGKRAQHACSYNDFPHWLYSGLLCYKSNTQI